ncbi:MAG: hypothetical protein JWP92_269 [Caulobacter sp.]|nr:hypothetical protein [Caulobacter sp.]
MSRVRVSNERSRARNSFSPALAWLSLATVWPVAAAAQATQPVDAVSQMAGAPSAQISNGLVTVKVLLPDAEKGFYRGARFDWSGVVGGLTFKGQQFYGPWFSKISPDVRDFSYDGDDIVAGPNTAMTGPADEFDTAEPQGWAAAQPGGVFVKIGVGALRKPDDVKYSPFRSYQIVDPGRRTLKVSRDAVTFTHTLNVPATGYAYVYKKTLRLPKGAPRLLIVHSLRNTGSKTITTTVYNHNFLTFGGGPIGAGLSIATPFAITSAKPPAAEAAAIRGDQIVYLKTLRDRDRVTAPIEGYGATAADNAGKVSQADLKAAVAFHGDQPLSRLALWSIRSVVALEPFVTLVVAPGREVSWTYAYDYFAEAAN